MDRSGEDEAVGNGAQSADTRTAGGDDVARVLQSMKWGLVPSFTKKGEKPDHYRMVRMGVCMYMCIYAYVYVYVCGYVRMCVCMPYVYVSNVCMYV